MLTLWLIPDQDTYIKISQLIEELSTVHDTPRFEPHVTLLSGIIDSPELALEKTKKLAAANKPLNGSLTGVEYLEMFYRCLFFRTEENDDIMNLRASAEELFNHSSVNPFIPHISFLYGSMPVFKKDEIIAKLGDKFLGNFKLQKLRLVQTELMPDQWEVLGEFELGVESF